MSSLNLANKNSPPQSNAENSNFVETTYRKITYRLVPFVFICWVLNYLDRVNVSFAQLHLKTDLGLSNTAYGFGVSIFFLGYILLEVPSTIYLQHIGARKTIFRIMLSWGCISTAMAFMTAPWHFYVARALLGAAEAGFWPGIILFLSYWYPSARRARITSRFLLAIAVAALTGGPLSGFILHHFQDVWGYRNWQWLFFLEGVPSVIMGIAALFWLTDKPEQAAWLDDKEKKLIRDALEAEHQNKPSSSPGGIMAALRDPRIYVIGTGWATVPLCGAILNYWTPTIIKQAGIINELAVGFLTPVPYIVGAIAMLLIAHSSDKHHERRWHFAISTTIGAVGAIILAAVMNNWVASIASLSLISISYFAAAAIIWTIPPIYLKGEAVAGGIGFISTLGQVGAFVTPLILGWIKDQTGSFAAGILFVAAITFIGGLAIIFFVPREAKITKPE